MITIGELKFNFCESVLTRIDRENHLPRFDGDVMRIASAFGGGVGGCGSVRGVVAGVAMAFGLIHGTEGNETFDVYQDNRERHKDITQSFMAAFEGQFGSVNCMDLLGVDRRTDEGSRRYDELRAQGVFRCEEYVEWSAGKALELLSSGC